MNHLTKDLRKLRNEAKQLLNTVQKKKHDTTTNHGYAVSYSKRFLHFK